MKSLKKTLVLLVVLSMILSAVSPVFAFSDVIPEEYAEQANKMGAFGVFAGDDGKNFKAEETITRAEMAVIIGKLMGLTANEADANKPYASGFSDVAAGEWYTGWVNLVAGKGIISGFPDGTFRPNEKVTQAQAVTMIVKALGWGVVVDQTGTWPANYITKASELRLFKDAVATESDLVTRGNVAIYCYNALTAKTWDVTSSEDGKLTSSKTADTILAKYFSDFVNEDGEMKLVEDATVLVSGANTTEIGANQIKLSASYIVDEVELGIAGYINAERAPKKDKENVTYRSGTDVVAYVAEGVADLSVLAGKEVDVIFGKNNEVVYVKVTDDAIDKAFVTAWDIDEAEIEIDGEVYEVNANAVVSIFGYEVTNYLDTDADDVIDLEDSYTAVEAIDDLLVEHNYEIAKPTKVFNRSVLANVILDEDGDVRYVNFIGSLNGAGYVYIDGVRADLDINEVIVEKVSKTGAITAIDASTLLPNGTKLEKLDDDKVTVIKDNEVVSAEEIKAGNVLTVIAINDTVKTIYVSDAVVEGTVEKVKNDIVTIDGTAYNTVKSLIATLDGELKDATGSVDVEDYFEEDVVAYLNFVGEVVAMVAESEATQTTVGMIVRAASLKTDADDVDYLSLRILTADGSKATYKIYLEDEDDTFGANPELTYAVGTIVLFSADADKVITLDDEELDIEDQGIAVLTSGEFKADGQDVKIVPITSVTGNIDYDKQTIELDKVYRFNSSTVLFNTFAIDADDTINCLCGKVEAEDSAACGPVGSTADGTHVDGVAGTESKLEIASDWTAICGKNELGANATVLATDGDYLIVDGTRVRYCVFNSATYMAEEQSYAVLVDTDYKRNADDDKAYFATLFVDGEETEYEVKGVDLDTVEVGDFVEYVISDGKITTMTSVVNTVDIADTELDVTISSFVTDILNSSDDTTYIKARFEVDEVDEGYIYFVDDVIKTGETPYAALKELVVDEDGCIIYDLRDGSWEMFDGSVEDLEGLYVVGFRADTENYDADIIVIFE